LWYNKATTERKELIKMFFSPAPIIAANTAMMMSRRRRENARKAEEREREERVANDNKESKE
jgi:hypothetical protein